MERLTKRIDGWVMRKGCHGICRACTGAECADLYPMIDRLADYEDTGLTPEEVKALVPTPNDPLTLEELREMDGQPVWVVGVSKVNNFKGHWDICEWDGDEGVIFPYCGETPDMDLLGTSWFAYRHRLEEGSDK